MSVQYSHCRVCTVQYSHCRVCVVNDYANTRVCEYLHENKKKLLTIFAFSYGAEVLFSNNNNKAENLVAIRQYHVGNTSSRKNT